MTQADAQGFVWCGHALRPQVPQDIAAGALVVAVGDAAFFANPRCYNEIAVAVYERTPVLLCLAPGVEPAPWFVAMLHQHPLRTLVMDPQQDGPLLEQRIAQLYAAWVQEEPQVHRRHHMRFDDHPLNLPIEEHGIILRRVAPLTTSTNVPHLVTHHSPSGYDWGYHGSGPADLTLNILEWLLRREGYTGDLVRCLRGYCFRLAWALHQEFARDMLAGCDRQETHISLATVQHWLETARQVVDPMRTGSRQRCEAGDAEP